MLYVRSLVLEVTRRCNMLCDHCMRGDAQVLDMSSEILDKVFEQVQSIGDVTFSGGEPTLAIDVIEQAIEHIRHRGIEVSNFFVVTNGKTTTDRARRMALALLDLYSLLGSPEEGITGLTVSGDFWHEDVEIPAIYKGLSFFREERHGPRDERGVINEGRAFDNGIGHRSQFEQSLFEVYKDDDRVDVGEVLYIAANGNVSSTCDISYARIDSDPIGNVLKEPLLDIINRHSHMEETCNP